MQEAETEPIDGRLFQVPKGLKELMSDITREVLRAQPPNVCEFIAKYLSALLQVRSNATIAGQLCEDIHHCSCQPELDDELRKIGLPDEDVETAKNVIDTFLENGGGKETSLLLEIMKNTSIKESQVVTIQRAVRKAFHKHHLNQCEMYQIPSAPVEQKCVDNVSSVSLAGSFINLPKHVPYSVHNDTLSDISERTCDTHTSKEEIRNTHTSLKEEDSRNTSRSVKLSKSNTLNTIYQREGLDKENVRFKTEMVKYISNEELTDVFVEDKRVDFKKDTMYLADSRSVSSSDD